MTTTETDRLRAENERLTKELRETRMQAISDFGQYQDSFDTIERLTKERDEALKNFNIVWDDREVARMQLADAVARAQAAEAEVERLTKERDEAQRNYLNTKGWWNAERESARKHEGTIAGMRTEIAELEARAQSAEAALAELREAAKLVISATVKSDGSMFDALDALRSLVNKGGD